MHYYLYIDFDRRDRVLLIDSLVLSDDISSLEEKSHVWKIVIFKSIGHCTLQPSHVLFRINNVLYSV